MPYIQKKGQTAEVTSGYLIILGGGSNRGCGSRGCSSTPSLRIKCPGEVISTAASDETLFVKVPLISLHL